MMSEYHSRRREPEPKPAPVEILEPKSVTVSAPVEPTAELPKPAPEPTDKKPYRVLSRIVVGKVAHEVGSVVSLSPADAESLGQAVTSVLNLPVAEEIAKREAGIYEVAGPGSVWTKVAGEERARQQPPGTLLELSAEDARDLGTAVRAV